MSRPQFTLRTLLTAIVVAAAFLGGMALQKKLDAPKIERHPNVNVEFAELPDGTRWIRTTED